MDQKGKILMFCGRLPPSTFLHAVDLWSGVPMPSILAHFIKKGRREEVVVLSSPYHNSSFPAIYKAMDKRKQIKRVKLGESTIFTMNAQDAFDTGNKVVKPNPLLAVQDRCDCDYCRNIRKQLKTRRDRIKQPK